MRIADGAEGASQCMVAGGLVPVGIARIAERICAAWARRKSSHSNSNSNCVEVRAGQPDAVAVRDSKDRGGPELGFTAGAWAAFVRGVKQGEFDLA